MSVYPIQATFSRGELSPRLHSRIDIEHYRAGLQSVENWFVLRHGGLRKRSGTRFIAAAKNAADPARLLPFVFGVTQAYVLEFGEQYFRAFAGGGAVVETAQAVIDVSQASPGVMTVTGHGFSDGDWVYVSGIVGMSELNGRSFEVANKTANTFELSGVDTTGYAAYSAGGTAARIVEVATPYAAADLEAVDNTQSADVLYLTHRGYAPHKATRTSATSFTNTKIPFKDGPYLPENETATTLDPDGTSGNVTVTASAIEGINAGQGFLSTDVGRLIRWHDGTNWFWLTITAVNSTTEAEADVEYQIDDDTTTAMGGHAATKRWRLGSWSDTTGWPARCCFYQDRLVFARSDEQPQTIWMSKAGDLEDMSIQETVADDDAIDITILSGEVNEIAWIAEAEDLLIGTTGATRTLGPATSTEAFSATNVRQRRQTSFGSKPIQPVRVGDVLLYVGYYGTKIREFVYSFEADGYVSPELSILSEHLLSGGIRRMQFAQEPDSIVWCVEGGGRLLALTYERDQELVGMTPMRIAGTDAAVEDIAGIPGDAADELWLLVSRTVGGQTRRHIERMEPPFEGGEIEDAFFVDSGLTYEGQPTGTVQGLDHVEGEEVAILADGAVEPPQTVTGGAVTLANDITASKIHVGLLPEASGRTMPLATAGQRDGSILGRKVRVGRVIIDVMETKGLRVGVPEALETVMVRSASDPMGSPSPLQTGFFDIALSGAWDRNGEIVFESAVPLPATIRSMTPMAEAEP